MSFKKDFVFDEQMKVTNFNEVMEAAKQKKPHFFKSEQQQKIITDSGTPQAFTPGKTLTFEQLKNMSRADRLKNAEYINNMVSKGLVT